MNTASTLFKSLALAFNNLDKFAPEHNPFQGHTTADPVTKSRFRDVNRENVENRQRQMSTLLDLIGDGQFMFKPGKDGAVCIIVAAENVIGTVANNTPIDGNLYTIETVHGSLQARGEGNLVLEPTKIFTIVLTPEKVNNTVEYALASVYPGQPDADPVMPFEEGQKVHGLELRLAGITRVC